MELKLQPEHLRIVLDIFARHAPGAEVWAYGSRVCGHAHAASDLDLVIRGREKLPRRTLSALHTAFAESALPIQVHLFDWFGLPAAFHEEIACGHVTIQPP